MVVFVSACSIHRSANPVGVGSKGPRFVGSRPAYLSSWLPRTVHFWQRETENPCAIIAWCWTSARTAWFVQEALSRFGKALCEIRNSLVIRQSGPVPAGKTAKRKHVPQHRADRAPTPLPSFASVWNLSPSLHSIGWTSSSLFSIVAKELAGPRNL